MAKKKLRKRNPQALALLQQFDDLINRDQFAKGRCPDPREPGKQKNFGLGNGTIDKWLATGEFNDADLRIIQRGLHTMAHEDQMLAKGLIYRWDALVREQVENPLDAILSTAVSKTDQEHDSELAKLAIEIADSHQPVCKGTPAFECVAVTLGVIYALRMAITNGFQDEKKWHYRISDVANSLAVGDEKHQKRWLAGYYLSDAIVRFRALESRAKGNPSFKRIFESASFKEVVSSSEFFLRNQSRSTEDGRKVNCAKLMLVLKEVVAALPTLTRPLKSAT